MTEIEKIKGRLLYSIPFRLIRTIIRLTWIDC